MGWTQTWNMTRAQVIEELTREQEAYRTLAKAFVGNTMYAVHEFKEGYRNPAMVGKRFIGVYLLAPGRKGDLAKGWGYKDMDETMGPAQCDCPIKLLDMVEGHDTGNKGGKAWRDHCRALAERKRSMREHLVPGFRFQLYGNDYEVIRKEGQRILIRKLATGQIFKLARSQIGHVRTAAENAKADAIIESLDAAPEAQ